MKKLFYIFVFLTLTYSANAQWVQVWNGMGQTKTIYSLGFNNGKLFAGLYFGGIYTSTNDGLVWSATPLTSNTVTSIVFNNSNVFASDYDYKIYKSIDNGVSWPVFVTFPDRVNCLLINGTNMFAGIWNSGVYYSTNNGLNWMQSFLNDKRINTLVYSNNYLLAGSNGAGVYYSTDNGYIWSQSSLNNKDIYSLCVSNQYVFAGTYYNGIYRSSNNGLNWVQVGLNSLLINSIVKNGSYLYAGTYYNGIYISGDNGLSWLAINDGLPGNTTVKSIVFTDNYIIVGTDGNSTYRRPKSQVGIEKLFDNIPTKYHLSQNYPNPFNPTTNIRFEIPKSSSVKLTVFDINGREVATLVNENLSPGSYGTQWDASKYSSGIYYYRMQTENFTESKRMILIK